MTGVTAERGTVTLSTPGAAPVREGPAMVPGAWDASVSSVTEGDGLDVVGPARTTPGGLAAAALAPGEVSQPGAWRATREPSSRSRLCSTVPTISSPHAPPSATARTRTTTSSVGAGYTMYSTASGVLTSPGSHLAGRLASSAGPISTGRSRRADLDGPVPMRQDRTRNLVARIPSDLPEFLWASSQGDRVT